MRISEALETVFEKKEPLNEEVKIEKRGDKWEVVDSDGEDVGTHDSEEEAKDQVKAIKIAKKKDKEND
jgi:hypothetical protein